MFSSWSPARHCHNCGQPYPWTERRLAAAEKMADEIEELSLQERETLKRSISDMGSDGPQSELAASRYVRLRRKLGNIATATLDKAVSAVATEAVKKLAGL